MRILSAIIILTAALNSLSGQSQKLESKHFKATFDAEVEEYAKASVNILEVVWTIADRNGFKLPESIKFKMEHSKRNALYYNRKNRKEIVWEYVSPKDFLPPEESRKNNIYGLCHEMGHLCMFSITHNKNNWMSGDYREGWADYFGNCMVDSLYRQSRFGIWPEAHDYRAYAGMEYFEKRIEKNDPDLLGFNAAGQFWHELSQHMGFGNLHDFFEAINTQKVNNPGAREKFFRVLSGFVSGQEASDWDRLYGNYLILNQ